MAGVSVLSRDEFTPGLEESRRDGLPLLDQDPVELLHERDGRSALGWPDRGDDRRGAEHVTGRYGEVDVNAMDEDTAVFPIQQRGLRSRGYQGVYLSSQERRVQYYHQVIDEYIAGAR